MILILEDDRTVLIMSYDKYLKKKNLAQPYSGGRAHSDLICWDLRTTRSELGRVRRTSDSNQRISFDLDPWGKYLATGCQSGK